MDFYFIQAGFFYAGSNGFLDFGCGLWLRPQQTLWAHTRYHISGDDGGGDGRGGGICDARLGSKPVIFWCSMGETLHVTHWVYKKLVPFLRTNKIRYFRASYSRRHALGMLYLFQALANNEHTHKNKVPTCLYSGWELSQQWRSGEFRQIRYATIKGKRAALGD